ncbi:MAG: hypothetical protein ACOYMR_12620 [Ilumatobacteraceae bacterium]
MKRHALALAAVLAGVVFHNSVSVSAAALPANTPPAGVATLSPTLGVPATNFGFSLPAGASCPGDGVAGYRVQTYIIANSLDASQLNFTGGTPTIAGAGSALVQPLFSSGSPVVDTNPALTSGAVLIAGTNMQLNVFPANTFANNGIYKMGVACTDSLGDTQRYWETKIATTVNGTGVLTNWTLAATPAAPSAPATVNGVSGTLSGTVAFTAGSGALAVSSVVVTATSSNGGTAGSVTVSGSPTSPASYTITGLTNGKTYTVSATATNAAGTSAASPASAATTVYDANFKGTVSNVISTPVVAGLSISWAAPVDALGATNQPNDYTITVNPADIAATTVAGTATSASLTGLTAGVVYLVTVTPNFTAPANGAAGSSAGVPSSATVSPQPIDVTKPVGALVLTQRCGVYGALPAEAATNAFPAQAALPEVGIADPFTQGLLTGGTSPTVPGGGPDPSFDQYPYPVDANGTPSNPGAVTYPTNCGLSMGTAQLITSGSEAGKYFRAAGRLNQITVVDTRNFDVGWVLQGQISDFSRDNGAEAFSGNYLGWTPVNNYNSSPTLEGYDMLSVAGPALQPNFVSGLHTTAQVLGAAPASAGLGIAAFDARLRLLIPVTKDNGVYTATLTISVL